jgi:hypothetical protein
MKRRRSNPASTCTVSKYTLDGRVLFATVA